MGVFGIGGLSAHTADVTGEGCSGESLSDFSACQTRLLGSI